MYKCHMQYMHISYFTPHRVPSFIIIVIFLYKNYEIDTLELITERDMMECRCIGENYRFCIEHFDLTKNQY